MCTKLAFWTIIKNLELKIKIWTELLQGYNFAGWSKMYISFKNICIFILETS